MKLFIKKSLCLFLITIFIIFNSSCLVDRLREPIKNFEAATSVVVAQSKLSFSELNRIERSRFIKKSISLKQPIRANQLIEETTFYSAEDLEARYDALAHLSEYASLLSQLVNSKALDEIAKSATNLEASLNALAVRIKTLSDAYQPPPANSEAKKPNDNKLYEKFKVFSAIAREVLSLLAKKKQEKELKNAILNGETPVKELLETLRDDLKIPFVKKRERIEREMTDAFKSYNLEVAKGENANKAKLEEYGKTILDNLEAQDIFYAANPTEAIDKMQDAHSKMIALAKEESSSNLADAITSIQLFVESANRLGTAVIKLKDMEKKES